MVGIHTRELLAINQFNLSILPSIFLLALVGNERDSPGGIVVLLIAVGYFLLSIKKSLVQSEIRTLKAYKRLQAMRVNH